MKNPFQCGLVGRDTLAADRFVRVKRAGNGALDCSLKECTVCRIQECRTEGRIRVEGVPIMQTLQCHHHHSFGCSQCPSSGLGQLLFLLAHAGGLLTGSCCCRSGRIAWWHPLCCLGACLLHRGKLKIGTLVSQGFVHLRSSEWLGAGRADADDGIYQGFLVHASVHAMIDSVSLDLAVRECPEPPGFLQ